MTLLNETHDVSLTSWVSSANQESDFPIQNLPFALFRRAGSNESFRGGVAIGSQVLDMAAASKTDVFPEEVLVSVNAATEPKLNRLMSLGQPANSALRLSLSRALRTGSPAQRQLEPCLIPQTEVEFDVPCTIGDYTDFYTSIYHATTVGTLFRPDNPLMPNYKWVPIAYHGRASTVVISGHSFPRPLGQTKPPDANEPNFGPCQRLDYELELGIYIGAGNPVGEPILIEHAENHVFGLCLFNDWSARDIQAWEYQPLGPFLGKNFASSISPWIVTLEALAPYRIPFSHPSADPQPLDYLTSDFNSQAGGIDIKLSCAIETDLMRRDKVSPFILSNSNFKYSYWTVAQMVAHHTVNGCSMKPGDLLGSGTQSAPSPQEVGSLLELTLGGRNPITLPNGESRTFIEDGDSIIMSGFCENEGAARIGFGQVQGTVLPARS